MSVKVRLFAAARSAVGQNEVTVKPGTLEEILNDLGATYPDLKRVLSRSSYLLNEVNCSELTTLINESDTLDVLPPFAGG